ncbi:MAG TPA: hypothetical protein VJ819_05245 [Nocardioidaceae bacterium]|nr:hypothetical protein [Nocardioidaceae bacterium]
MRSNRATHLAATAAYVMLTVITVGMVLSSQNLLPDLNLPSPTLTQVAQETETPVADPATPVSRPPVSTGTTTGQPPTVLPPPATPTIGLGVASDILLPTMIDAMPVPPETRQEATATATVPEVETPDGEVLGALPPPEETVDAAPAPTTADTPDAAAPPAPATPDAPATAEPPPATEPPAPPPTEPGTTCTPAPETADPTSEPSPTAEPPGTTTPEPTAQPSGGAGTGAPEPEPDTCGTASAGPQAKQSGPSSSTAPASPAPVEPSSSASPTP